MGMAVVVIANDFPAINVALPPMDRGFDPNANTIQCVINAYALTFGLMIVTGGRLADLVRRGKAFFLGTAIFASMSALGGAAQSESWQIIIGAAGVGNAIRPLVGGVLTDALGWRWIFFLNVPIFAALLVGGGLCRRRRPAQAPA